MDNEKDLLRLLDTVNRQIMQYNEWELGVNNISVDFEDVGQFPERVSTLFFALGEGLSQLGELQLLGATLLILPYTRSGAATAETTDPLMLGWQPGRPARWVSWFKEPDDVHSCKAAVAEAMRLGCCDADDAVFQLPYFVRAVEHTTPDQFNVDSAIYREPKIVHQPDDCAWVRSHPSNSYVQRFVFTFVCCGNTDRLLHIVGAEEGAYLNHVLGAFFSFVGVAADDVSRFQVERISSFHLLRTHQLGNELKALFQFGERITDLVESAGDEPSLAALREVRDVFDAWKPTIRKLYEDMAMFSQVANTLTERKAAFGWYEELVYRLDGLGARSEGSNTYTIETSRSWRTASRFDLNGVSSDARASKILYTRYHFDELIDNLYKNAKRAWEAQGNTVRQEFRVTADIENGHVRLSFSSQGEPIRESLRAKLFRQPVPKESQVTGGNGIGLWALGMSMRTFGISLPCVDNEVGFGPRFTFKLPRKADE